MGAATAARGVRRLLPEPAPKPVRIDFDKLQQRIVALPLPARAYLGARGRAAWHALLLEPGAAAAGGRGAGGGGATLTRFDLKTRKSEKLADGVGSFDLSANGDKMLLRMGGGRRAGGARPARSAAGPHYVIVPSATPVKPGEGALKLANIEVNVDPIAEWKQMYHEVWRIERSYFYDPNLHGVNAADAEKEYEKYLDSLSSRADLNYIFKDMMSDMTERPPARRRRQYSAGQDRPRRPAGRGLRDRQRPLPLQEDLHRRKLEPAIAGAAGAAGLERQ